MFRRGSAHSANNAATSLATFGSNDFTIKAWMSTASSSASSSWMPNAKDHHSASLLKKRNNWLMANASSRWSSTSNFHLSSTIPFGESARRFSSDATSNRDYDAIIKAIQGLNAQVMRKLDDHKSEMNKKFEAVEKQLETTQTEMNKKLEENKSDMNETITELREDFSGLETRFSRLFRRLLVGSALTFVCAWGVLYLVRHG